MTDWMKKWPWWKDGARMRVGLLKRPQPQVPHLVKPKYTDELLELAHFALWVLWRHGGRQGPRPEFDKKVPKWSWDVLGEYQKAHPGPKPTPPPGPEPVSIWKNPPVRGLGFHVAWGFTTGQFS